MAFHGGPSACFGYKDTYTQNTVTQTKKYSHTNKHTHTYTHTHNTYIHYITLHYITSFCRHVLRCYVTRPRRVAVTLIITLGMSCIIMSSSQWAALIAGVGLSPMPSAISGHFHRSLRTALRHRRPSDPVGMVGIDMADRGMPRKRGGSWFLTSSCSRRTGPRPAVAGPEARDVTWTDEKT